MINLPPMIKRKCKDRDCEYDCGGKYYLELSSYDNGFVMKYMCQGRFISVIRSNGIQNTLEDAINECAKLNNIGAQNERD